MAREGSGFISGEQSWNSNRTIGDPRLRRTQKALGPLCGAKPVLKPIELPFPKYRRSPASRMLAEPAFPLTPLMPAMLKPGDHQLQRSDSQPGFNASNKGRGMAFTRGATPVLFRHEIRASQVPWTGRTQFPVETP